MTLKIQAGCSGLTFGHGLKRSVLEPVSECQTPDAATPYFRLKSALVQTNKAQERISMKKSSKTTINIMLTGEVDQ